MHVYNVYLSRSALCVQLVEYWSNMLTQAVRDNLVVCSESNIEGISGCVCFVELHFECASAVLHACPSFRA